MNYQIFLTLTLALVLFLFSNQSLGIPIPGGGKDGLSSPSSSSSIPVGQSVPRRAPIIPSFGELHQALSREMGPLVHGSSSSSSSSSSFHPASSSSSSGLSGGGNVGTSAVVRDVHESGLLSPRGGGDARAMASSSNRLFQMRPPPLSLPQSPQSSRLNLADMGDVLRSPSPSSASRAAFANSVDDIAVGAGRSSHEIFAASRQAVEAGAAEYRAGSALAKFGKVAKTGGKVALVVGAGLLAAALVHGPAADQRSR